MFGIVPDFDRPWWLLLLIGLPVLWWLSWRSMAGLSKLRWFWIVGLRSIVYSLLVAGLAELQFRQIHDRLTVYYLLDQSESIPSAQRQTMLQYAIQEVARHRDGSRGDRAGVIIFGREARVEVKAFEDDLPPAGQIESGVDLPTDATDISSALKLARANFLEDSAKRVVLVTDGNENQGDVRTIGRTLAEAGIGLDVVPIVAPPTGEVSVDQLVLPADIREGQTYNATILVTNQALPTEANPDGTVAGTLRLVRKVGEEKTLLAENHVDLKQGKNPYPFQIEIDQTGVFTYEAEFVPDDPGTDSFKQNNLASAFTHVQGKGRVLMIEDWAAPGQFDTLIDALRRESIEVDLRPSNSLFTSLAELQAYDCVILANVPRSSDAADNPLATDISSFTDDQIGMLVRNTQQMGNGLVMIGGENSFGAGGWAGTELENAMPVDFTIKNAKVQAVGALCLMMHASELSQGNYWQKVVAREAIKTLGPTDYCGLIHWNDFGGGDSWLWTASGSGMIRVGPNRQNMLGKLDRMNPGDMPDFNPAMRLSLAAFSRVNASVKHMIVVSDGDPVPPTAAILQQYKNANIQISTVAIGTHGAAGSTPLQQIATFTGGKYYVVNNAKALPRIYQREARKVTRSLLHQPEGGVGVGIETSHEILGGISGPFPKIRGYVLTTVKESPLVEVILRADDPATPENSTILAAWPYGLGRSVAFTSDAGAVWTRDWVTEPFYQKLFAQSVRWSIGPVDEKGNISIATQIKDGRGQVIVTALDKDNEFRNNLNITGSLVTPELKDSGLTLRQVGPGKYVADFELSGAGSHLVTLSPGPGEPTMIAGLSVPYSDEFRRRETNEGLLTSLAELKPQGGETGEVIQGAMTRDGFEQLLKTDTFRHTLERAFSGRPAWHLALLLAAGVFFFDVFFRRVQLGALLAPSFEWLRNRVRAKEDVATGETMERLRSVRAAATAELEERRAATRFEPTTPPAGRPTETLEELTATSGPGTRQPTPPPATTAPQEEESYTARLLAAKKRAQKKTDN